MSGGMLQLRLAGAGRGRGLEHARQAAVLAPVLRRAITARLELLPGTGEVDRIVHEWQSAAETRARDVAAEIDGLADGFSLPRDEMWRYAASGHVLDRLAGAPSTYLEGCSLLAWTTADAGPVLVKNRDYLGEHRALQCVSRVDPPGGHAYLCVTSVGSAGVFSSGINSVGLAVADAHVATADLGPGLHSNLLMTLVLESCSRVAAAVALMRELPRAGGCTLLVADATGTVAAVECGHREIAVRNDTVAAATNHFRSLAHGAGSVRGPVFEDTSHTRLAALEASSPITVGDIQQIMSDHTQGALCQHRSDGSGTISTTIYLLASAAMLVTPGAPCMTSFERFELPRA